MNRFHNASHKQSDELSFELFDRDRRVITGPGKYGFDRDEKRAYVLSNAAHSVLTIDKKPWPRQGRAAYGSGIAASGVGDHGWFAVLGRNPLTERQGITHTRLFVYHPIVGLFIFDTVDSRSGKHEYRRYLQFGEDIDVDRTNKRGLELDAHNSKADFDGCVRDEVAPTAGSNLRLDRGMKNPYEGYTFPRGERGIPRWAAVWRSKATDVSHLYGIGLQRGCPFSVRRVAGTGLLDFVLAREGEPTVQITVTRSDSVLNVTETQLGDDQPAVPPTPPPAPPVPPIYTEQP
jgi:Heparinase II/III-like protein